MANFDEEIVHNQIMSQCNGRQDCKVSIPQTAFGLESGWNRDLNYETFIFVQVGCEQDEEMLLLKNVLGLCSATLGLAICMIFRNEMTFR